MARLKFAFRMSGPEKFLKQCSVDNTISIVDTRESKVIWEQLVQMGWQRQKLDHGDFQLGCGMEVNPLVERKSVVQLLGDMKSGVLTKQLRSFVNTTPFPILLIEGHWRLRDTIHLLDSQITWEQAWNELESLQDLGCRLQLTTSIAHTLQRLPELIEYYSKSYHESISRQIAGDHRIATLCLIPGIGEEKARAITDRCPSLQYISVLTTEELDAIPGIGEELAQRIYRWFR